jgi:hypothetical protein
MPKPIVKAARVETAYGNTLAEPVTFSYEYEELQKGDTIPADEMPDSDDLRSFVNQKRNAAARSKAQNAALDAKGIQKPTLDDPDVRLKAMINILVKNGVAADAAEQQARAVLGM